MSLMNTHRSDRACTLCRQRRVRCDKSLPACQRCSQFGQPCPGYSTRQRFVDQSSIIRSKHGREPPPFGQQTSASLSLSRTTSAFPGDPTTQAQISSVPRSEGFIPEHGRAALVSKHSKLSVQSEIVQSAPLAVPSHLDLRHAPATSSASNPSPEGSGQEISMQQLLEDSGSDYFDIDIDSYYAIENNACGFFPGIPVADPPSEVSGKTSSAYGSEQIASEPYNSATTRLLAAAESPIGNEVALLTHLFVDILAPWMDLLDIDGYFTRLLLGTGEPDILLQSAVAAVAAKQTARHLMNGRAKSASTHYAYIMANYQDVSSNEWFYRSACYYDCGISHLRACLQQSSSFMDESLSVMANPDVHTLTHVDPAGPVYRKDLGEAVDNDVDLQRLFSAIAVLSLYESLDDCSASTSRHLPGFLALFSRIKPSAPPRSMVASRAAFWYLARKEGLASYAHHIQPGIDPDDHRIWISAGVPIQVFHFLSTDLLDASASNLPTSTMKEDCDLAPCILVWALVKVTDLMTSGSERSAASLRHSQARPSHDSTKPGLQTDHDWQALDQTWSKLRMLLEHWYGHRPALLVPHAVISTKSPYKLYKEATRTAFYTSATGAATSQLYHFIQILLLLNQPTNQADQTLRMRTLKNNSAEVEHHSREILAIALGCQPLAIQRHMSHPLQLAGAYFETQEDRDAISELLRQVAVGSESPTEAPG